MRFLVPEYGGRMEFTPVIPSEGPHYAQDALHFPRVYTKSTQIQSLYKVYTKSAQKQSCVKLTSCDCQKRKLWYESVIFPEGEVLTGERREICPRDKTYILFSKGNPVGDSKCL